MKKHRWIGWLLVFAFGVLVIRSFTDFRTLVATLLTGQWPWLLAAVILHLIYFLPYAQMYESAFAIVDVSSRLRDLVPLVFAAIFANAVAPSGGASAAALFVNDAARRGQSGARAAVGTVLVLIADLVTLVPFLLFGLFSLYRRHDLQFYDVIGGAIFLLFVGSLCLALLLAKSKPGWLRSLFSRAQRLVNRAGRWAKRPHFLADEWAVDNAAEFTSATEAIRHHPRRLASTLGLALLVHGISLASLYAIFQGYRQPVALGPLTAGFGMGIVFWVITVIPHGVGATEGIMTLVFMSFGVPRTRAITIALVFRGVNFYLPLLIGLFCLRHITAFRIGATLQDDGAP
jgi:glycosyltransferase 2 family protein